MSYFFKRDFEYGFDLGEVDAHYLSRVETAVHACDGVVINSDRTCLTLNVSVAKLSKHKLIPKLVPFLLSKNLIMITVDSENRAAVKVRNPIRKYLYRSLFLIFSATLITVLIDRREYVKTVAALPVVVLFYLAASRLPPMAEYPRLRDFLIGQKE